MSLNSKQKLKHRRPLQELVRRILNLDIDFEHDDVDDVHVHKLQNGERIRVQAVCKREEVVFIFDSKGATDRQIQLFCVFDSGNAEYRLRYSWTERPHEHAEKTDASVQPG